MEGTIKDKMIGISNQILSISRNELYISMRFLDMALNSLTYQLYLSTTTVGTDGEKILYNPNYLVRLYRDDMVLINRGYFHMLLHCLFRHMMAGEGRDKELWDIACDIAVESIIDEMDYKCIRLTVSDYREEIYNSLKEHLHVLAAEGIYHVLKERNLSFKEIKEMGKEFEFCDHSIWDRLKEKKSGNEQSEEDNPNKSNFKNDNREDNGDFEENNPTSPNNHSIAIDDLTSKDNTREDRLNENWKNISERVQSNLEITPFEDNARGLSKALKVTQRETYDYKEFLRKFSVRGEEIQIDMDSFDYVFYNYGLMNYKNMPFIEPLEYKDVALIREFVIIIDTSASCSGELIRKFIEESYRILTSYQSFAKKTNIYIIQCDDKVQDVKKIRTEEELLDYINHFESKGYGETDFRPAFTYINKLVDEKEFHQLKGVLYFTDGEGIYPVKRPGYDVAFVFVDDSYSDIKVPSWAMKLFVTSEGMRLKENLNK